MPVFTFKQQDYWYTKPLLKLQLRKQIVLLAGADKICYQTKESSTKIPSKFLSEIKLMK